VPFPVLKWYTRFFMFGSLGFGEILVICIVLIIVVGPERLPSLMKNVGKAVRTVRQASRELQATVGLDEILREDVLYTPHDPPSPPPAATISRDALPAPAVAAATEASVPAAVAPAAVDVADKPAQADVFAPPGAPPPTGAPAKPAASVAAPGVAPEAAAAQALAVRAPEAPGGQQGQA
jgi:sec-independent protein translocase protein TatB